MKFYNLFDWPKNPPTEKVSLVAVGGLPVFGLPENWRDLVKQGFAHGAVLTYGNPKNKTPNELAELCSKKDHMWWLGGLTATWFINAGKVVELEFARANVCHMSWEAKNVGGHFVACFDLRSLNKYLRHKDDNDFHEPVREVMHLLYNDLIDIAPWITDKEK